MNYFGVFTLITALLLYAAAIYFQKKENYSFAIGFVCLAAFCLYFFVDSDPVLHHWDECFHALVAKNMRNNLLKPVLYRNPLIAYDYKNWTSNYVWIHKPPMVLWLQSFTVKWLGTTVWGVRLPSMLMALASVLLVFKLGNLMFNKKVAFWGALLFSFNGLLLELISGRVATDHIDVGLQFFVLCGSYLVYKWYVHQKWIDWIWVSVLLGMAYLTKSFPALLLLLLAGLAVWIKELSWLKKGGYLLVLILGLVVLAMPWELYKMAHFPVEYAFESKMSWQRLFVVVEDRTGPWYYFMVQLCVNYHELIYLPIGWSFYKLYQNREKRPDFRLIMLLAWILIPVLVFSFSATKMKGYTFLCLPAITLLVALFFVELQERKWKSNNYVRIALMVLLFVFPVRYGVERLSPFIVKSYPTAWISNLIEVEKQNSPSKTVIVGFDYPIEAMYYTDFTVYPFIPSETDLGRLRKQGYQFFKATKKQSGKEEEWTFALF